MRFQRRVVDIAGVVRDGRCRDDRYHLEQEVLAEAGYEEPVDILISELSALFDQRARQGR